ncbi:MAG TPA: hypothetical protein VGD45_20340 [Steroidobacter sp.]|uniref:hypothetical protein n=1 Tax=Steroidobacter sp. TaxID=1978227 RepID=UPI002ED90B74
MSTVYTIDGRAVRVLSTLSCGRKIVELAYEDDGELYFSGEVAIVAQVFDNPPVEAQHKEITHLEAMAARLRDHLSMLQDEVSKAEQAHKERIAKLKRYESLKFVEEFLDGKLTHYVIVHRYNPECIRISTPAEEIDTENRWEKKQKLLSLFGTPANREIGWWLEYEQVFPFTSLEDARAKAAALLADAFKKVRSQPYSAERAIASAKALDIPVPDDLLQIVREYRQKSAQQSLDEARKKLAEAEKAFAAVGVVS